jgi:NAD(P)-dependent dehydrogenase (short-subunit alcohol dehydrogenase family)
MDLKLQDKRVLITGASKGIGYGLAETLASEGANLYLVARSEELLQEMQIKLTQDYKIDVKTFTLDIKCNNSIEVLQTDCADTDILVNNAGDIPSGNLFDVDDKKWMEGWELKVHGYIRMSRVFYQLFKERGSGVILNNIGNGGEIFDSRYIAGVSGNASLIAFTKALGATSLNDNIRVLGVNPGPVNTERIFKMLKKRALDLYGTEDRFIELANKYPLSRPAHVREVTDAIAFLISERASYISGSVLTIDGGISSNNSIV